MIQLRYADISLLLALLSPLRRFAAAYCHAIFHIFLILRHDATPLRYVSPPL